MSVQFLLMYYEHKVIRCKTHVEWVSKEVFVSDMGVGVSNMGKSS